RRRGCPGAPGTTRPARPGRRRAATAGRCRAGRRPPRAPPARSAGRWRRAAGPGGGPVRRSPRGGPAPPGGASTGRTSRPRRPPCRSPAGTGRTAGPAPVRSAGRPPGPPRPPPGRAGSPPAGRPPCARSRGGPRPVTGAVARPAVVAGRRDAGQQQPLVFRRRHLLPGGRQQLRNPVDDRVAAAQPRVVQRLLAVRVGEQVQRTLVERTGEDPQQRVVGFHGGVNSSAAVGDCGAVSCLGMASSTATASTVPATRRASRSGSSGSSSPNDSVPSTAVNRQVTVVHTGTISEARQRWSAACDITRPNTPVNSSRYGYGERSRSSTAPPIPLVVRWLDTPLMASELTP